MKEFLEIKEYISLIFSRYNFYIKTIFKLIFFFTIYTIIFNLDTRQEIFDFIFDSNKTFLYIISLSILSCFLPLSYLYFFSSVLIASQLSQYIVLSTIFLIIMTSLTIIYARIAEYENFFILATIVAFQFNVPFIIPILAGLYFNASSIIPIIIGIFTISFFNLIQNYISTLSTNQELAEITIDNALYTVQFVLDYYKSNNFFVFSSIIFLTAFFICYVLKKMHFKSYNYYALAGSSFFILLLHSILMKDFLMTFLKLIFSIVIVFIVMLFDNIYIYDRIRKVKFEDEENLYFVKVIPKIYLSKKNN